jgi:hypothetical protein
MASSTFHIAPVPFERCRLRMEQIPQVLVMDQSVFGT